MKILTVMGTRPEVIKLAPVIHALATRRELQSVVCVTGQHRQMLDSALELFNLHPDHDLNVMADNQTPAQVASAVLAKLEPVLQNERPDWVLVQGDTTTSAAAALAASYGSCGSGTLKLVCGRSIEGIRFQRRSIAASPRHLPTYTSRRLREPGETCCERA